MIINVKTIGIKPYNYPIDPIDNLYKLQLSIDSTGYDIIRVLGFEGDKSIVMMCNGNIIDMKKKIEEGDEIVLLLAMYGG